MRRTGRHPIQQPEVLDPCGNNLKSTKRGSSSHQVILFMYNYIIFVFFNTTRKHNS